MDKCTTIQTSRSKQWVKMHVSSSASLRTAYFHYDKRIPENVKTIFIVARFFKSTGRFAISLLPRRVQTWRLFLNFTTIRRLSPTSAVIGTLWWWWPKTRKIFQPLWHPSLPRLRPTLRSVACSYIASTRLPLAVLVVLSYMPRLSCLWDAKNCAYPLNV